MKKRILFLVAIVLLLVGCKQEKIYLEEEFYEKSAITEIDVDTFKKLEKEGKEFALYVYLPGCTSCAAFKEVLVEFGDSNKIEFYAISITEVKGTSILEHIEYAPSMFVFKDGKVIDALDATSDKDKPALTTVDGFTKWLEEYIYLTK